MIRVDSKSSVPKNLRTKLSFLELPEKKRGINAPSGWVNYPMFLWAGSKKGTSNLAITNGIATVDIPKVLIVYFYNLYGGGFLK